MPCNRNKNENYELRRNVSVFDAIERVYTNSFVSALYNLTSHGSLKRMCVKWRLQPRIKRASVAKHFVIKERTQFLVKLCWWVTRYLQILVYSSIKLHFIGGRGQLDKAKMLCLKSWFTIWLACFHSFDMWLATPWKDCHVWSLVLFDGLLLWPAFQRKRNMPLM